MPVRRALLTCALTGLLCACQPPAPPPPHPLLPPPPPEAQVVCPGGLLCESDAPVQGWRVPRTCVASELGRRVATCWLEGGDWQRVVEFVQSRYPHAKVSDVLIRVEGQVPLPTAHTPTQPLPTPPLLLVHQRPTGVELVFLAGDLVDTPRPATETEGANPDSRRRAP